MNDQEIMTMGVPVTASTLPATASPTGVVLTPKKVDPTNQLKLGLIIGVPLLIAVAFAFKNKSFKPIAILLFGVIVLGSISFAGALNSFGNNRK